MNYMEWALEKAKKLWREREQVMKERLSRAVAAGSGGKAAGEMNADKTAVREAVEKRQKRGLPDETEDAETAAQRLTRKLSGEDSGQRFKAEETEGRAAPVGMTVRDTASPQMRIADNGERAAAWLWQELGKSVKSGAAAAAAREERGFALAQEQEVRETESFSLSLERDENNQKRLRDLENGQCLLQDLYGRVGVVQIHPVFEELLHAFDTRPPVQRNEVE